MSTFRQFMKQNVKQHENVLHTISDRFCDENGEPLPFTFKVLGSKDVDDARDAATIKTKRGRRGDIDVDTTKLMHTLITKALVIPDLEDKELQDSYSAVGSSDLISKMFDAREYSKISTIVSELAGFDKDDQELIDDAKNS